MDAHAQLYQHTHLVDAIWPGQIGLYRPSMGVLRSTASLARRLPDLPRWVEVRDLLLSVDGEIIGPHEEPDLSFVLREPGMASVFVVGTPDVDTIQPGG